MSFDPQRHHRRSIRLPEHDYSDAGIYFFTSCTHQRECLFGDVVETAMVLSEAGKIAAQEWENLSVRFPTVGLDAFVVMPNHIHGIVFLNPLLSNEKPSTLSQILRVYKSLTAVSSNRRLDRAGQPLWQRNYYEHIIRNGQVLEKARRYILLNPEHWERDAENPINP